MITTFKTRSKLDFNAGQYVGIKLCYLHESVFDTMHPKTLYTPYEVFKIKEVKKSFNIKYFGLRDEIVLETPDHQLGYLFGTSAKESLGPTYSVKEYTWTLDEGLISWIEKDLGFTVAYSFMILHLFDSTSDVQKAIQNRFKCKTEHTIQQEIRKRTPQRYHETPKSQGPSETEINDLFYKG